jgi:hypothetical protein
LKKVKSEEEIFSHCAFKSENQKSFNLLTSIFQCKKYTCTGLKRLFINIASAKSYANPDLNIMNKRRKNIQALHFKIVNELKY